MARSKIWFQHINLKQGVFHEQLGVSKDKKIPAQVLDKPSYFDDLTLARRTRLAKKLKKMYQR